MAGSVELVHGGRSVRRLRRHRAAWLAWGLCLVCIGLTALGLAYGLWNHHSLRAFLSGVAPYAILAVSFPLVGALIATHRPENPLGWIFCTVGLSQALLTFAREYGGYAFRTAPDTMTGGPLVTWLAAWVWVPGTGLLPTFVPLLFPNGRLPSRQWRPLAWLAAVLIVAITGLCAALFWPLRGSALIGAGVQDVAELHTADLVFALSGVLWLLLACGLPCVTALILRFRRASGIERLQLKWFLFASAITTAALIGIVSQAGSPRQDLMLLLSLPALASIPIAAGIAILRFRLYEIDRIINRTLVYGLLTSVLAVVYAGLVLLPARLFGEIGAEPSWLVAGATLAVAALFQPARLRIQAAVDRRFNRRRYDAGRMAEAFSIRLRDQIDLDALSTELLGVINRTVEPATVSLWIRPSTVLHRP